MKEKVLVVDDEPSIVNLVSVKLSHEGYRVVSARDGEEALEKVRSERPDLVLLDVMMPKLDGKEVCMRLKRDPATKDIPVVMLTAAGEFGEQLKGLELGADEYMTKPFDPKHLVQVVAYMLEGGERPEVLLRKKARERQLKTIIGIMHRDED